ncbi:serine/threonine-protein kinase [Pyrobaculum sp.]|uniref:serine/threonine-protein kinase n=1 Tax=Pyrobaculum sp. TaxID=2004705 RepID=UPI00316F518F
MHHVADYLVAVFAVVLAVAGWFLYRHIVAIVWGIISFVLLLYSTGVIVALNTTLIALILLRAVYDRYRDQILLIFIILTIMKMVILTEYYINEKLVYIYYFIDGIFIVFSILIIYLYRFKPLKIERLMPILVLTSAFVYPEFTPVSVLAGTLAALIDVSFVLVALVAVVNFYYLTALGQYLSFLPPLVLILSYIATYKRVLYLSVNPPIGWLYSWLGGRYKVIRLLGVGGFSYVLLVKFKKSMYAVKILRFADDQGAPLAGDENILYLFGQEMNRYLELKTYHVVRAYEVYLPAVGYKDIGQYMRNPPYILLEYMDGGTLRDLLRAKKRLPAGYVAELFRQLAQGLYDIHRRNIIHLDIKPENILFTKDRKVAKIGDMGIAKVAIGGRVQSSFMSPAYAAPEVKKGEASFSSDIYSLGCVIYEALTGINPNVFVENGYAIPPPSAYAADVPPWMDEIILKMLDLDPAKRPTAADLVSFIASIHGR